MLHLIVFLFFLKIKLVKDWKTKNCLKFLGIPRYISSGSLTVEKQQCRYLIMDRFQSDFENTLKSGILSTIDLIQATLNVVCF